MGLINSNISYTGLVEKYIGTAYDKVVAVYNSLSEIEVVAETSSATWDTLADNSVIAATAATDATTAKDDAETALTEFQANWLGSFALPPTTNSLGATLSATDEGLLYYDSANNKIRFYSGTAWVDAFMADAATDHNALANVDVAEHLDWTSDLSPTYSIHANNFDEQVTISDTQPVTPTAGMRWLDSTTGATYSYYNDGTTSQWIQDSIQF